MATVIKSTLGTRQALPIAFSFENVSQQGGRYIDEVQSQASTIIADAHRQADAVRHRAEVEGREAALKTLDEKVGQRMQTLLPALEKVVAELADARQAWL